MNTYRTEFFAFCPVNSVRVKYALLIETTEVIKVEQIIDEVSMHSDGYHEEIADDLFRAFGGRQTLLADHHGVTIETLRGDTDCAWCKGSGVADTTGYGDLERCDRCAAGARSAGDGVKNRVSAGDYVKLLLRSFPAFRTEWNRLYDSDKLPENDLEATVLVLRSVAGMSGGQHQTPPHQPPLQADGEG